MADSGTRFADEQHKEIERRIRSIYEAATKDIIERLNEHSKAMYAKDAVMRQKVEDGEITQKRYKDWLAGQLFVEKNWKDQISEATNVLLTANEQANAIVEGARRAVFTENANWQEYKIEQDLRGAISFTLYDSATVTRLLRDQPNLLPPRKVDGERDKAWNREKISSVIARGVISGDSIPKIARNIGKETGSSNEKAMLRYARTAMTGAQNAGRLETMRDARDMGIKVKKLWIATLDDRARDAHAELDGHTAEIDEPFDSTLGPIMFPGDPGADDANIWNCFIGETKIASDSSIVRSYKHDYSGELITVKTSGGVEFTCTPNHPILTPFGWVSANRLNEGNDLIIASVGESDLLRIDPDVDHIFPRMDTFHELFKVFPGERASGLCVNFHGDIPTTDVEIISKEGFLRSDRDSAVCKRSNKFLLKDSAPFILAKSHLMACLRRIDVTTLGFMRGACKPLAFFWRRLCHSVIHGFRAIAGRNSSVLQAQGDAVSCDLELLRKRLDRFPGKILTDKIISINVSTIRHVPVFNLQTDNEYYFVNPIVKESAGKNNYIFVISHNCRCTLGYEYPEYASGHTERYDQHAGEVIDDITYEEWLETKHPDWKEHPTAKTQEAVQSKPPETAQSETPKGTSKLATEILPNSGIPSVPITKWDHKPTEDEIISEISGADKTSGSCASVALAYAGNKAGYAVHDFRGGNSMDFFSRKANTKMLAELPDIGGKIITGKQEIKIANQLLATMEAGKEYWLGIGRHASIVRKTESGYQYLELQSSRTNGWKPLNETELKYRFGCVKRRSFEMPARLMEGDKLTNSNDFIDILQYINTKKDDQRKGEGGGIK